MIVKYNYLAFKNHLIRNPKWIARGLQVLYDGIPGPKFSQTEEVSLSFMVRQLAFGRQGGLPWTLDSDEGRCAVAFVNQYSPSLYKFYTDKLTSRKTTS